MRVEEYLDQLFDSTPRVGRGAGADARARFRGVGKFIFALHQNRTEPFRMSRPDVLPLILPHVPGLSDSGLRRTLDALVEAEFIIRVTGDTAQNSKLPHLYYWSSEALTVLGLAGPDIAVTIPKAILQTHVSDENAMVEMRPAQFDHNKKKISSLGEDIMVETRSKDPEPPTDWRARSEAYRETRSSEPFDRVSTKGQRVSTKGEAGSSPLTPVEVIPTNEVVAGIPLVGRTPDGTPITGTLAGFAAMIEERARKQREAEYVRPKPTEVKSDDAFSLDAISKRVGFTVRAMDETREERAARIAEEDAEREAEVQRRIKARYEASIESEVETRLYLLQSLEGRQAVAERMLRIAELKSRPMTITGLPPQVEEGQDARRG